MLSAPMCGVFKVTLVLKKTKVRKAEHGLLRAAAPWQTLSRFNLHFEYSLAT
jgi:hypothetical protein